MTTTYGWTGSLLRIDLSTGQNSTASSRDYTEHFIGGRMLGARLYWDEVSPNTRALDADNVLMILPGPLAGTQATACSRWVMAAKSPYLYPDQYSFANSGGFFGAAVKQAGFDAVLINGKAAKPSYILLEDSKISFHDASGLLGLATDETIARLQEQHGKGARVVCTGPAGEKMVSFALAMADQGGALGNGMGAVMGSKNLKAIVIKAGGKIKAADPDSLKQLNKDIRTARKSQHESIYMTDPMIQGIENLKPAPCYGCPAGCARAIFKHTSGREEIRKTCAAAFLYSGWDTKYHGEATEYPFLATSLCDKLGLCTQEISNILYWFSACREQEALSKDKTGLDLSQLGSQEFFEKLIDMIVTRTGFGDLLALGIRRAGIELGGGADELARAQVTPSGYVNDAYSARLYLPNGIAYATEARNPIIQLHEYSFIMLKWSLWYTTAGSMSTLDTETLRKIAKRDWGSEAAADLSTYDGKARAGFIIQNRQHAKETMVACDRYFPILDSDQTGTGLGDPTFVPRLFSAVTGQDLSLDQYFQLGERSMNLQRAIMAREGRMGREQDALGEFNYTETIETEEGMVGLFNPDLEFPAAGDEIITLKGKSVDRDSFEKMKDDYYSLRGWDITTGLQTQKTLDKLKLSFVAEELDDLEALKK